MSESKLHMLKDAETGAVEHIEMSTGRIYADPEGLKFIRKVSEVEYLCGEGEKPVRDGNGHLMHVSLLANAAAEHMYRGEARLLGRGRSDIPVLGPDGRPAYTMDDRGNGRKVLMDLAVADVHQAATLPRYAGGYHIADGLADIASPVLLVPKQSDYYYTANYTNDFNRKAPSMAGAPGANIPEINPAYTATQYNCLQYTLGGFLPTEVQANADAPLKPFTKLVQMVVDAHRLEREYRVFPNLLGKSGSFNSNLQQTIAAGSQWNGGPSSDPVANLHQALENSFLPCTAICWSERVEHDFLRNPAVQKYFQYKDMVDGLPDPRKLAEVLRLPPIYTGTMKYASGGNATYVLGNNVVLLHQPATLPPTDQMEVATSMTFRWTGGQAPDGTMTGGLLVRTYFDPKRGARGGTMVVVVMEDIELMTSNLVGGVILSAHQ